MLKITERSKVHGYPIVTMSKAFLLYGCAVEKWGGG